VTILTITVLLYVRLLTVTLAIAAISACAGVGNTAETTHSCSPSYVDEDEFGRVSAQQAGPGALIQWGVYPKRSYQRYTVRLYIDSRKLSGGRDQDYEPRGTVDADVVMAKGKTGSVFRLEGETHDARGQKHKFVLRCRLA